MLVGPVGDAYDLIRGHEIVHVLQHDFMNVAWSRPLEAGGKRWLFGREFPVDFSVVPVLLPPFARDLWEAEARVLDRR